MKLRTNIRLYNTEETSLTPPELIGYFSLNSDREYQDDFSELKFIKPERMQQTEVNMDLNMNFHGRKVKITNHKERLHKFLTYFKHHRGVLDVSSKEFISMDDVPFVCRIGSLGKISKIPYEKNFTMRLNICLANGVIYMDSEYKTDSINSGVQSESTDVMCSWGFKFGQYIASETPHSEPNTSVPLDENSEFHSVFTSTLGGHKLIYGAETDAVVVNEENEQLFNDLLNNQAMGDDHETVVKCLKNQTRIEMKTTRILETETHLYTFKRYKSLKWWAQTYFSGADPIVVGFRNDDGIVEKITPIKTQKLADDASGWSGQVCLNFCCEFLSYVKRVLIAELKRKGYFVGRNVNMKTFPVTSIVLQREPGRPVMVVEPLPMEDICILEKWFLQMVK